MTNGSHALNVSKGEGAHGEKGGRHRRRWRWKRGGKLGLGFISIYFFHCISVLLFSIGPMNDSLDIVYWIVQFIFIVIIII